jgi:hypothetical protein
MRREKFVFNKQTLQYDRVVEPLRYTILRGFAFCGAAVFTAILMMMVVHAYFPSPGERLLSQENDILRSQIDNTNEELTAMADVLESIQDRDAGVYRMIFREEPIDRDVWQGGRGGHDAYGDLRELPRSGEHIANLRSRLDDLKHRLDLQSRSLDDVTTMIVNKEDRIESVPSIKPIRSDQFNRKIENLSGFGMRLHPIHGVQKMHYGIDFNCKKGTPIQASGKGKVVWAGNRGDYGKCVIIDHGYGFKSLYGHMSKILIKNGAEVERGAKIGLVGSTGGSTGDHLHYEVHKDGKQVNPIQFCYDGLTTEEYAQLVNASQVTNKSWD